MERAHFGNLAGGGEPRWCSPGRLRTAANAVAPHPRELLSVVRLLHQPEFVLDTKPFLTFGFDLIGSLTYRR